MEWVKRVRMSMMFAPYSTDSRVDNRMTWAAG